MKRTSRWFVASLLRVAVVVFASALWLSLPAYAHGGMAGPDELGPPMAVSGVLAFISYWVVLLWPRRQHHDDDGDGEQDSAFGGGDFPGSVRRRNRNKAAKAGTVDLRLKLIRVKTGKFASGLTERADYEEDSLSVSD